jgi:urocanate hydratase
LKFDIEDEMMTALINDVVEDGNITLIEMARLRLNENIGSIASPEGTTNTMRCYKNYSLKKNMNYS